MSDELYLAIDVGTGSVRAALVDRTGRPTAIRAFEHEQIVPEYGWSEQRPADWWAGVTRAIRAVLDDVPDAARRIAKLVDQNLETHGPRNSVVDVWINLCPAPAADQAQMLERIGQSLPEELAQSFQTGDPEIVRPIACKAGVGFALAAWDSGILNEDQVKKIVSRALGETYMDETFDREGIRAILEGFQPRNAELPAGRELAERIL